jgi:hypothetical protein
MGTSKSFGGAKGNTPLIPSWLSPDNDGISMPNINPVTEPKDNADDIPKIEPVTAPPVPVVPADSSRFEQARSNFARNVSSDGTNKSALKRGISSYIKKSYGGAKQASKRMSVSKVTASKLVSFFTSASTQGFQATLLKYNLSKLQGIPLEQACSALVDEFCKSDGKIDTAISRDAFLLTIQELEKANMLDKLEKPDDATILFTLKKFMVLSIYNRLIEDVGQRIFLNDKDPTTIQSIEIQIKDYIEMAVDDVIIKFQEEFVISDLMKEIDKLYESSYETLDFIVNKED